MNFRTLLASASFLIVNRARSYAISGAEASQWRLPIFLLPAPACLLDAAGLQWISCEPEIFAAAAQMKARGGLSVADAWIAATAFVHGATLVHKDPEFRRVGDVAQETL